MDSSRNERARARARARDLLAQIAPCPTTSNSNGCANFRSITSMKRTEGSGGANLEPSEQTSAALDEIARDYFAGPSTDQRTLAQNEPQHPSKPRHR